jgi:hypothetical protein
MIRLTLHNVVRITMLGARTIVQIAMALFLTKQLMLRDWFEKAIS